MLLLDEAGHARSLAKGLFGPRSGAGDVRSHAVVSQLSFAPGSGTHAGTVIRRWSANACRYGSYAERISASRSTAGPGCSDSSPLTDAISNKRRDEQESSRSVLDRVGRRLRTLVISPT